MHAPPHSCKRAVPWHPRRAHVAARARFFGKLFGSGAQEGPQLVPVDPDADGGIGGTSDALFGPLAVLLIGFLQHEVDSFRSMMLDMDADIVRLICCNRAMLRGSLQDALEVDAVPDYEQAAAVGTRRAVILSGMSSAEVLEVIDAYRDAGLPPALWAAAVPMNYERPVRELLEDIARDHAYMMEQRQQPT
ncbi:hypothetical protein WJX81_002737 [Elliptochloris bilobata]|uniref:Uncharacterized protein n=1 Tax=Elliptochloris bilobata TaxID=381761 RepID=A0AAW1RXH1_9CHLO